MDALDAKAAFVELATAVIEYDETRVAYTDAVTGMEPEHVSEMLLQQLNARRDEMIALARRSLAAASAA